MGANDLDKREKGTVIFAALFLVLALFMAFYVPNSWGKRYKAAKAQLAQKEQELQLARLDKITEEERVHSQQLLLEQLEARGSTFSLFPFVNSMVSEAGLSERAKLGNATSARNRRKWPKHPMVELELTGVSLEEVVDLLYKIRSSKNLVSIYTLEMEPAVRDKGLRCEITFVSVKV
ncbi:MAG: hypothetical protein L3K26_01310 [Candidatus Hydrogenedentes bacterium]|nr:hypothetical protein [Candidatus Hydrogenedentota bacterium]